MAAVSQPFVSKLRANREHIGSDNGYRPPPPTPRAATQSVEKVPGAGPPAEFAFTVADSKSAQICREVLERFAETLGGTSDEAFVSLCVAAKREQLEPTDATRADDADPAEWPE